MKPLIPIILFTFLTGCDFSGGPNGSWWVGKPDKGVYVYMEDNDDPTDRIYKGIIYSGTDESIIFEGEFDYSLHTIIDYQNSELYYRWDGERLYLRDNSFLKAIK